MQSFVCVCDVALEPCCSALTGRWVAVLVVVNRGEGEVEVRAVSEEILGPDSGAVLSVGGGAFVVVPSRVLLGVFGKISWVNGSFRKGQDCWALLA